MKLIFNQVNKEIEIIETARLASEIWHEYYISILTVEQIDYMVDKFQSIPAITDQINNQGYEYYLFQPEEASAVGYLSVKEEEGRLFLSKFYIAKAHRGKGYASQAMSFLEQLCKERALNQIWLTVNRYNESSIAVYRKKGFIIEREQVADIGNGYVMDDYVMVKEIGGR